jgi:hypothetical protein
MLRVFLAYIRIETLQISYLANVRFHGIEALQKKHHDPRPSSKRRMANAKPANPKFLVQRIWTQFNRFKLIKPP